MDFVSTDLLHTKWKEKQRRQSIAISIYRESKSKQLQRAINNAIARTDSSNFPSPYAIFNIATWQPKAYHFWRQSPGEEIKPEMYQKKFALILSLNSSKTGRQSVVLPVPVRRVSCPHTMFLPSSLRTPAHTKFWIIFAIRRWSSSSVISSYPCPFYTSNETELPLFEASKVHWQRPTTDTDKE